MDINEVLIKIQSDLKAPKGQYNDFGKYHYRSCEDILEAVKPLLKELNVSLTLSDEIVNVGDRYYIKAIATLANNESNITVTAYAREEESKKGMDSMQLTGATSSYARKYALNGLFAIDDTKDSDDPNFNGDDDNKDKLYYSIKSKYELIVNKKIRDWEKANFPNWYKEQKEKFKPQQIDAYLTKILKDEQR